MGAINAATQKMIENIINGTTPPTRANAANNADKVNHVLKFGSKVYDGSAEKQIVTSDIGAEPAFTKNTAFNKNFGSAAGTVCQGNDSRLSDARKVKSTNTTSKIYLVGTTSQNSNGADTYSHDTAYVGSDGHLYSGGNHVAEVYTESSEAYSITYPIGTVIVAMRRNTNYAPTNNNNGYNMAVPVCAVKNPKDNIQEYAFGTPFLNTNGDNQQRVLLTGTWRMRGYFLGYNPSSGAGNQTYFLLQRTA